MARLITLLSTGLLIWTAACTENVAAPGVCPEFCPSADIELLDSVFTGVVTRDSAFRGYVLPREAARLQLIAPGQDSLDTRAAVRFLPFTGRITLAEGDTTTGAVIQTDSLQLVLQVIRRTEAAAGIRVAVHRLPDAVDSSFTLDDLAPFFADSTLLDTLLLPDTITSGAWTATFSGPGFPLPPEDSVIALGLSVAGPSGAWVTLGAVEGGNGAALTRFLQVDSGGEAVERTGTGRLPAFDTFVSNASRELVSNELVVGGSPSARSLLRIRLPEAVVDSSDVIRATLILVPTGVATGAPGDSLSVRANLVTADIGPKSPISVTTVDSILAQLTSVVPVGSADTILVDITTLVRFWGDDPDAPRSVMLQAVPEGASPGELRFGSSRLDGFKPAMRVTFIPAVTFRSR